MKMPLLVSVCGMEGVGISVACARVAYCLNSMGINTMIVELGTPKLTEIWEDSYILGSYRGLDVVILMRHGFTHSAVKQRLTDSSCRFKPDSVRPDIAVLMTCDDKTYAERNKLSLPNSSYATNVIAFTRLNAYRSLAKCHWGTEQVAVLNTDGPEGRLYAAGNLKMLILKELGHATDTVA